MKFLSILPLFLIILSCTEDLNDKKIKCNIMDDCPKNYSCYQNLCYSNDDICNIETICDNQHDNCFIDQEDMKADCHCPNGFSSENLTCVEDICVPDCEEWEYCDDGECKADIDNNRCNSTSDCIGEYKTCKENHYCETPCDNNTCGNYGRCENRSISNYVCICDEGYQNDITPLRCKPTCETVLGNGELNCEQYGVCELNLQSGAPECKYPCDENSCGENGVCEDISTESYRCICNDGYQNEVTPLQCKESCDSFGSNCPYLSTCYYDQYTGDPYCLCRSGYHISEDGESCIPDQCNHIVEKNIASTTSQAPGLTHYRGISIKKALEGDNRYFSIILTSETSTDPLLMPYKTNISSFNYVDNDIQNVESLLTKNGIAKISLLIDGTNSKLVNVWNEIVEDEGNTTNTLYGKTSIQDDGFDGIFDSIVDNNYQFYQSIAVGDSGVYGVVWSKTEGQNSYLKLSIKNYSQFNPSQYDEILSNIGGGGVIKFTKDLDNNPRFLLAWHNKESSSDNYNIKIGIKKNSEVEKKLVTDDAIFVDDNSINPDIASNWGTEMVDEVDFNDTIVVIWQYQNNIYYKRYSFNLIPFDQNSIKLTENNNTEKMFRNPKIVYNRWRGTFGVIWKEIEGVLDYDSYIINFIELDYFGNKIGEPKIIRFKEIEDKYYNGNAGDYKLTIDVDSNGNYIFGTVQEITDNSTGTWVHTYNGFFNIIKCGE